MFAKISLYMEQLTKTQVVLLVLLVSFFTSLVTGIVTVTLVNQAPDPVVQNINRIIERTVERVVPAKNQIAAPAQPIIITTEDLIVGTVEKVSSAVVSVIASKDLPVIEQYFENPLKDDEFFKNIPEGFLPDVQVPQYRQKGVEKKRVSSGTGFFVSKDGIIITNKHIVADAEAEYSIILNDGRKFAAEVLAKDPFQDIAILKVKIEEGEESEEFNFISLGNSDKAKVGQTAIAIGNSLGKFQNTVSVGIISGLDRKVTASGGAAGPEELQELIQTDAAINPGNSGGPLIDLDGRAIGINTAMASGAENVGFALPINIAKRDIKDAKEFGEVKYPFIGIRYQVVNSQIKEEKGLAADYGLLLIKGPNGEPAVVEEGPAKKAGLKEEDIILELNGKKLDANSALAFLLSKLRVGNTATLKYLRGEKEITTKAILEERPEDL